MKRRAIAIASLAILAALCATAFARPGGGESFSGGGGHGGGGGFGGGGSSGGGGGALIELFVYLIELIVFYPYIGIPVLILIIWFLFHGSLTKRWNRDWDSGPAAELAAPARTDDVRALDPDFSQAVFEDFAFRLFSTAQRARESADKLATVSPYVSQGARDALVQRNPSGVPVQQVIVGALRIATVRIPDSATRAAAPNTRVRVGVQFEANVATEEHTYYSVETWTFARAADRKSKPPGASRTFPCPNCGAPWQPKAMGTQVCASCGETVDNGRFDWVVESIRLESIDERAPTVTQEVPERGTDLKTYVDEELDANLAALTAADPEVTEASLRARLDAMYGAMNKGWAANDIAPARPYVSDALYDYLQYWIDTYKRQHLRNQLTDMRITRTELAKVMRDTWYDAVTIRLWGTGKDFVINTDSGRVLRGSKHSERPYSEYWTLIRAAGKHGKPHADATCANCGAPLHITMGGECEHCGAHVTAGEFDWVLSKIEQDDTYRG